MWRPEVLARFAGRPPFDAIGEIAAVERGWLGEARLAWLHGLPPAQTPWPIALVHLSPGSLWSAPGPEADD